MIKFALNNDKWVFAGDYENGMECSCPYCGERVVGRASSKVAEHFFHMNESVSCDIKKASEIAMVEGSPGYYSGRRYQAKLALPEGKIKRTNRFAKELVDVVVDKEVTPLPDGTGSYGYCTIKDQRVPILFDYSALSGEAQHNSDAVKKMSKDFPFFIYQRINEFFTTYNKNFFFDRLYVDGKTEEVTNFYDTFFDKNPNRVERFPQFNCLNFAPKTNEESPYFCEKYEDGFFTACYFSYRTLDYAFEVSIKKSDFLKSYLDQVLAEAKWISLNQAMDKIRWFLSYALNEDDFYIGNDFFDDFKGLSENEILICDSRPFRRDLYKGAPRYMKAYFKRIDDEFDDMAMGEENPYKKNFEQRWGLKR